MDRERLFRYLEQRYTSRREMISRVPLGTQAESLWQELLSRRRAKSTVLPICNAAGMPFWYVTTDKMVSASEKVVEMLLENEQEFDPYTEAPSVVTLEEAFYTGYVDGAGITMQDAMDFIQSGTPPRDAEEQLIINNRQAGAFASKYLYRPVDVMYLQELAAILTDGLDEGGGEFRSADWIQIPSMMDEPYTLPSARSVPDRAVELARMLDDPKLHPLVKAAAAQAWALTIRPFPDGNERLGRILSSVVLLRSGYVFFSKISFSALIAQKGYGYYESIANILREENGGDLTYFMEYFMDLLSRAVDERQRRMVRNIEEHHEAEIQLAHTPLTQPTAPVMGQEALSDLQLEKLPDKQTKPANPQAARSSEDAAIIVKRALDAFYRKNAKNVMGRTAKKMKSYVDRGKMSFSSEDLKNDFSLSQKPRSTLTQMLVDEGIIRFTGTKKRFYMFEFCVSGALEMRSSKEEKEIRPLEDGPARVLDQSASEEDIDLVKRRLTEFSAENEKNVFGRTALQLRGYLDRGKLNFRSDDLTNDFGLDSKKRVQVCTVLNKSGIIAPAASQGKFYIYGFVAPLHEVPEEEPSDNEEDDVEQIDMDGFFAQRPRLRESDYSQEILDRIRMLRYSRESSRDRRMGEILTHCLPRGVVTFWAYDDETVNNHWNDDMELVEQMGIVEKVNEKEYRILREPKPGPPNLAQKQKNVLSRIFDEFGMETFSQAMVVATLDYGANNASAMLHQFTLIRILERKPEDQDGSPVYQLLVNPEDHPECFNGAA